MEVILGIIITSLFWAICFFLYLAEKNKHDALKTHEEIRKLHKENYQLRNIQSTEYLPSKNNAEILRLENALREKNNEVSELEKSLQEKETNVLRLNVILKDKNNEIEKLKRENSRLSKEKNFETRPLPLPIMSNSNDNEIRRLHETLRKRNEEITRLSSLENKYVDDIQRLNKLLDEKENEILRLRSFPQEKDKNAYKVTYLEGEIYQKKVEITKLEEALREKDTELARLKKDVKPKTSPPLTGKRFVSVKFYKNAEDTFDYLMGKITDLKVGDRVMVPTKGTLKSAIVCYISKPSETSEYARSEIVSKIDKKTMMSLFD